jgi:MFS family permease
MWVTMVMMALIGTFAFNFNTVIPLFVHRSLGGGDATFTYLFSVLSFGSLTGALLSARRSSATVRDVALTAGAFGVAMGVLALAPNLASAFPIGFFTGLASIGFMTTCTTIVQVRADPSMRGRVLALQSMVFLGSTPIGGPLLGWICDRFGARAGLLVGAASAVVAAAYGLVAVRQRAEGNVAALAGVGGG